MLLGIYIPFFLVFLRPYLIFPAARHSESCSVVFESHDGYALFGHEFIKFNVSEYSECALKCMANDTCHSYNLQAKTSRHKHQMCELNNQSRISKPGDFKHRRGYIYSGAVPVSCVPKICIGKEDCQCHPGYKGPGCLMVRLGHFAANPGKSCKHILESNDSKGDGEYWIDPEGKGNPLKVYCDMKTDGGGWLLTSIFEVDGSTALPAWTGEPSYHGISQFTNHKMGITLSAMRELRRHLSFTQMRFHCCKQQGRTFHVTTAANNSGEAVVQYFSGQTNTLPDSCLSFVRMKDDNSYLSRYCARWGNNGLSQFVGKWGHKNKAGETRLYDHTAFVAYKYHWMTTSGKRLCDDKNGDTFITLSKGDFWKIFVR